MNWLFNPIKVWRNLDKLGLLGISRRTIYRKIEEYGLRREEPAS